MGFGTLGKDGGTLMEMGWLGFGYRTWFGRVVST
jgi:hypothetical protein